MGRQPGMLCRWAPCNILLIQNSTTYEIPLNNPSEDTLRMEVSLEGNGLTGDDVIEIAPKSQGVYVVTFAPSKTGKSTGT